MAQNASDSQKVDYLWKKIVYGAAKTDIAGNIDATNEPVASPLLIRGDKIWQQASSITNVIPGSNSSVVTVYPTTFPVECISTAGIPTPTLTWQTGQTFWVPPEFGSTYQIKVYIAPSGNAANVAGKGTQVFATGSGNNDLWVFDYQSGVLNFNSNNTPYNGASPISFTGNSVYISGAVYSGTFGLPNISLGNIAMVGNTITSTETNGNIVIDPPGTGVVQIAGSDAIGLPSGNTATRPQSPLVGYTRFNTELDLLEVYDGTAWAYPGSSALSSQIINPNGTSNVYVLSSNATTAGVLVSINGTIQQPTTAYNVTGNVITFSEIPLSSDVIEVRSLSNKLTTVGGLSSGALALTLDVTTNQILIQGNLVPSANTTYNLGSPTLRWNTAYLNANTLDLGGGQLSVTNGALIFNYGGTTQAFSANGLSTANTFSAPTVTIQGNLAVGGYINSTGNVLATTFVGSGALLTSLPGYAYSNVNIAAYTTSMGYQNFGNVNVIAYSQTMGFTNYSNVNIAAYTTSMGYQNFGNVNVIAYLAGGVTSTGFINTSGNVSAFNINTFTSNILSGQNSTAINNGAFTVAGGAAIQKDLWVGGNLYVANIISQTTNILQVNDPLLYLYSANTYPYNYDIGFYSHFIGGPLAANTYAHTGLVRDYADNTWKFFSNVAEPSAGLVNFADTNLVYDTVKLGNLVVATGNVTASAGWVNAGTVNATGNILATSFIGSGTLLTALPGYAYSNVNVVAYSQTMGFTNYSNVNAAAYTTAMGYTNYSNVNVVAYLAGGISSTGFINTSANVSASQIKASTIITTGNIDVSAAWLLAGTINVTGNVIGSIFTGVSTTAKYADLAENYLADALYPVGTVLEFGGDYEVTISNTDMSTRVAGVVSEAPAYLMNSVLTGPNVVALALIGRVPCQVTGQIRKGDLMVSAGDGTARATDTPTIGSIIGKALENFNGTTGVIEVVIGGR